MSATDLPPAQALCTACGLCCDGTLFGWMPLREGDTPEALHAAGLQELDAERAGAGERRMALPCPQLCGRSCALYTRWRPAVCHSFRCRLLRRLEAGEVSAAEARAIVDRTVANAERVRSALQARGYAGDGDLTETFRVWREEGSGGDSCQWVERNGDLLLDYAALQRRLDRDFRPDDGELR